MRYNEEPVGLIVYAVYVMIYSIEGLAVFLVISWQQGSLPSKYDIFKLLYYPRLITSIFRRFDKVIDISSLPRFFMKHSVYVTCPACVPVPLHGFWPHAMTSIRAAIVSYCTNASSSLIGVGRFMSVSVVWPGSGCSAGHYPLCHSVWCEN